VPNSARPNVILIFCDELRADALGCFGNDIVETPNTDRLSEEGTRFTQCMVTQPTCTPCRASVLSGLYPSALRSRMVGCYTPDDERFLPRVLGAQGYRTASIGKIHLAPQGAEPEALAKTACGQDRYDYYGFQEVDLVNGHGDNCFGPNYSAWLQDLVPDLQERKGRRRPYPHGVRAYSWELPPEVHSSNYIGDRSVEFLEATDERPFFLHVSFPDPHHPFTVPEPYASMYRPEDLPPPIAPVTESHGLPPLHLDAYLGRNYGVVGPDGTPSDRVIGTPPDHYTKYRTKDWQQVKAIYYGMVSLADRNIGRILNALDETRLAENTIVVFVSDHGDYLGDHGFYGKGFHYDSVVRTPLIYRGPGVVPGQRIDGIASVLDIAPTLLGLVGIEEPQALQGCSVTEVLEGKARASRRVALTENDDDFVPMKVRTITTADWKLTCYVNQGIGELFDRRDDPDEMRNLWNSSGHEDVKRELMGLLLEEVLCSLDVANGRLQSPSPRIAKWVPRHNQA